MSEARRPLTEERWEGQVSSLESATQHRNLDLLTRFTRVASPEHIRANISIKFTGHHVNH